MDRLLYLAARAVLGVLQALPLRWLARFGRAGGELVFWLDARHRRVARRNLTLCFGTEKTSAEIRAIVHENFRRIGENLVCALKTATMQREKTREYLEVTDLENLKHSGPVGTRRSIIFAIGHFGNFEAYAQAFAQAISLVPGTHGATTYRALDVPALDRVLLELREQSGVLFFERRREGGKLRSALHEKALLLGLLCDQHAGDTGLRLPFFGRETSTSRAPAIFALRYNLPLHTAICYRTALAHWRVEIGKPIPTRSQDGKPRSAAEIMLDVNQAFEIAIRRDPANWFWVHNRWKPFHRVASAKPATEGPRPAETEDSNEPTAG